MPTRDAARVAVLAAILFALFACSSPTPAPTPTSREATSTSVAATRTAVKEASSAEIVTATPSATPPPTATLEPTITPTIARPPAAPSTGWTVEGLTMFYKDLGTYPPESALPRPTNVDPLTGLQVADPAVLQRRPVLARIMNDASARPQTGLNEADLVFEELIDQRGGVFALTRFTAVYLANDATVRPMRSARLININLAPMFAGALVHSGASDGTRWILSQVPPGKFIDLDQYRAEPVYCGIGGGLTWVTTTVARVHEYLRSKNQEAAVSLRGFNFSDTAPTGTAVASIAFDKSPWPVSTAGPVEWRYDAAHGRFLRFASGVPHNTLQYKIAGAWASRNCAVSGAVTTSQVSAANLVVLYATHEQTNIIEDENKFTNVNIVLTGEGSAQVLRDGQLVEAHWRRPTLQHFFDLTDGSGAPISLKPGNTWFEIVPIGFKPTIK